MFSICSIDWSESKTVLVTSYLFSLLHRIRFLIAVGTIATVTLVSANFAWGETLAVHLQATSLFAVAASSFFDKWDSCLPIEVFSNTDVWAWADLNISAANWLLVFVRLRLSFNDIVINFKSFCLLFLFLGVGKPLFELQIVSSCHLVELSQRWELTDGMDIF